MNWLKKLWADKFRFFLVLALVITGIVLLAKGSPVSETKPSHDLNVHFFYHPTCPHCAEQKPFNEYLMKKYPSLNFIYHDVSKPEESALLVKMAEEAGIQRFELGVPATFFGEHHIIGFGSAETTGRQLEDALVSFIEGGKVELEKKKPLEKIKIPIFGEIRVLDYSIPALAVILGLVDGFNPCAMWVLVYLISVIMSVGDRRKILLIVGSFVFASGVLYFLFMTAWLNVFLLVGFLRPLTIIIGLAAVGFGIDSLKKALLTKGELVCEVGDISAKKKTMSRIESVIHSPLTLATIGGVIVLAFVVNSVEFVCSSALPAVFTQVLALSNLSWVQYYGYILLYDFFFMLDDLIIFTLAAFAVHSSIGHRYAKYCKFIGGIILLGIGLLLAFAPHLLR